jgi:hypothetical protein
VAGVAELGLVAPDLIQLEYLIFATIPAAVAIPWWAWLPGVDGEGIETAFE